MPFKRKGVAKRITQKVIIPAFEDTVLEAFFQLQDTIESKIFFWDRMTKRQNGSVVYSPRDIVDSRKFLRSQYLNPVQPDTAIIGWGVDYASTIFHGRKRADGTTIPGRDWIAPTLKRWDIRDDFAQNIARRLKER